jgi:hypothetical protein
MKVSFLFQKTEQEGKKGTVRKVVNSRRGRI